MANSENAENAGHAELESDLCCDVPSVSSELSIALGQAGDDVPFSWDAIKSYEMVWRIFSQRSCQSQRAASRQLLRHIDMTQAHENEEESE